MDQNQDQEFERFRDAVRRLHDTVSGIQPPLDRGSFADVKEAYKAVEHGFDAVNATASVRLYRSRVGPSEQSDW